MKIMHTQTTTKVKMIEFHPKRGGPAVWDPVCKLMVPCTSRGGYHVQGGGGNFMACIAPTLWLSWGARVRSVASLLQ